MPRHIDPKVEGRILEAARKLWSKGGEEALSMRAVARAARTNTPAVYRRFKNREDILRALVAFYQQELFHALAPCNSLSEVADSLLDFGLRHTREYQLIMSGLLARMTKTRPNLEFVVNKSAEWMGGSAEDHRPLVLALWSLTHGTIMLKTSGTLLDKDFPKVRAAFKEAIDLLIENRKKLSVRVENNLPQS